ncbi:hypothetical protein H6F44_05670 [Pseudanabaena sp. FACHB-1277]|uniref:Lipoprotein n=1 Tax=Pseudanabaena cinerea FACHB-1277 TaxID=2949581 RepID=A0A926Z789_9CYAN|nr:hypothetical protein [Pseudanabaena cinerea]MBD2149614.1 hypothetical protein [Pseudanabaena cinerea FACHB-1277]
MKQSFNLPAKHRIITAIACVAVLSACQQPEPPKVETAATPTASPTATTPAATPTPAKSPEVQVTKSPESTASPTPAAANTGDLSLDKIAGAYDVVLDPKLLAEAEKDGVKSVTGIWTIKPEGKFDATLKAVSIKGEEQEIKITGKMSIEDGKVTSQVELANGEKPPQTPPKQPYTISADGKELQADGQPVKLVRK